MQKVLWTKGILLSPQHLQAQDRYFEELVGFAVSAFTPFPWGFRQLELDRDALAAGVLSITRATGLLPDGLPFDIPRSDPPPPPKPLADHWHPDQDSLLLHLALPEHRKGGHNISAEQARRSTRFTAEVIGLRDENTGQAERPIQVARRNFRILAEGESLEGHSTLQVGRMRRTPAGGFQPDPHFVPPVLDIHASDYLVSMARRLVEILSAKSSTLSGMRRQRNQDLADFGVSDVANFWLLYTANTYLPLLRHHYEMQRGQPQELYETMLALAGSLTTFSSTVHPRSLPLYDHSDLGTCFSQLDQTIRELLETVVPTNHVALPLRQTEPSIYATAIDQDRYLTAPHWYLAINAQTKQDELLRRAPQLLKISSADQIGRLIRQALPGVTLRHVPSPPSTMPIKLSYQYFLLDLSGADWEAMKLARNLAVYVPSDFPDPQLELVILLPPKDR